MTSIIILTLLFQFAVASVVEQYELVASYSPINFFDNFEFFTGPDPTNGFVQYADRATAFATNLTRVTSELVYLGVDHSNVYSPTSPGRPSVRVQSKMTFTEGLFVLDLAHMPVGCGTWPAYWTVGPEWPRYGEIDIIEGINDAVNNGAALHADGDCAVNPGTGQTATWQNTNCSAQDNYNVGCTTKFTEPYNYGEGFNRNGGGTYVMEWTNTTISIWFFPPNRVPLALAGTNSFSGSTSFPTTANFGAPSAVFEGPCSDTFPAKFFNHSIVFDTTFCGGWAGKSYDSSSCPKTSGLTGNDACIDFVAANPSAFAETWWGLRSLRVWQKVPAFETAFNVPQIQEIAVSPPPTGGHGAIQIPGNPDFAILDALLGIASESAPDLPNPATAASDVVAKSSSAGAPFRGSGYPDASTPDLDLAATALFNLAAPPAANPAMVASDAIADISSGGGGFTSLESPDATKSDIALAAAALSNVAAADAAEPIILIPGQAGLESQTKADDTTQTVAAAVLQAAAAANAISNLVNSNDYGDDAETVTITNPVSAATLLDWVKNVVFAPVGSTPDLPQVPELVAALAPVGSDPYSASPAVSLVNSQPTLPRRQTEERSLDALAPGFAYPSGEADNWVTEDAPLLLDDTVPYDSSAPPGDPFTAYWSQATNPDLDLDDHPDKAWLEVDGVTPVARKGVPSFTKFTYASGEADDWVTEDVPLLFEDSEEAEPGDMASSVVDAFTAYWNKGLNPMLGGDDHADEEWEDMVNGVASADPAAVSVEEALPAVSSVTSGESSLEKVAVAPLDPPTVRGQEWRGW